MNIINPYALVSWTPHQLGSQLGLWLDASDVTTLYTDSNLSNQQTSQGTTGSIADVRGIGGFLHAEQLLSNQRPSSLDPATQINGLNTVRFEDAPPGDINAQHMDINGSPWGTPGTAFEAVGMWYVGRATWETVPNPTDPTNDPTRRGTMWLQRGGSRCISHAPWTNGQLIYDMGPLAGQGGSNDNRVSFSNTLIGGPDAANEIVLLSWYCAMGSFGNTFYCKLNGAGDAGASDWSKTAPPSPTPVGTGFEIGTFGQPQGFDMGEWLWTFGELSAPTRNRIEGYLAHKWGIENQLPSTGYFNDTWVGGLFNDPHPYRYSPP